MPGSSGRLNLKVCLPGFIVFVIINGRGFKGPTERYDKISSSEASEDISAGTDSGSIPEECSLPRRRQDIRRISQPTKGFKPNLSYLICKSNKHG